MLLASLLSVWMCAPLAPLNPLEQDTVNAVNLQCSLGMNSPSELLRAAPEFALRYEILPLHPFITRLGFEYKSGALTNSLHPAGPLQSYTVSFEALMYRGTKELTGFVGVGPLYTFNSFTPNSATRDSLARKSGIDGVSLGGVFGYRIIFGARYYRNYSLEVRFTETYPTLVEHSTRPESNYEVRGERLKTSSVSVTFGYLIKLK